MKPIRVVVNGATGRMGKITAVAVSNEQDLALVGAACKQERGSVFSIPGGEPIPLSTNLDELLSQTQPDVLVDFTNAHACIEAAVTATAHSINMVLGASGITDEHLKQLDALANDGSVGIIVAPKFALGGVVLQRLAEQAAPYFDYVEIVEAHHEAKKDAPSGFSLALAKSLGQLKKFCHNVTEQENLANARGGEHNGISIHSIRMPGRSAHHEVIFGAPGQTLTLRHDTLSLDCYMPGVVRCIRDVVTRKGLVVGLENVLGL